MVLLVCYIGFRLVLMIEVDGCEIINNTYIK
jgi:hypothetical protein